VPNPFENSGVRNSCEAFAMELLAGAVKPGKLTPHLLPEARLMIRSLLPGDVAVSVGRSGRTSAGNLGASRYLGDVAFCWKSDTGLAWRTAVFGWLG
jgi:hypothetical protein